MMINKNLSSSINFSWYNAFSCIFWPSICLAIDLAAFRDPIAFIFSFSTSLATSSNFSVNAWTIFWNSSISLKKTAEKIRK